MVSRNQKIKRTFEIESREGGKQMNWETFLQEQKKKIEVFHQKGEEKEAGTKRKGYKKPYNPRRSTMSKWEIPSKEQYKCLFKINPFSRLYQYQIRETWDEVVFDLLKISKANINRMDEEGKEKIIASCVKGAKNTMWYAKITSIGDWLEGKVLFEKEYKQARLRSVVEHNENFHLLYQIPEEEYSVVQSLIIEKYEGMLRSVLELNSKLYSTVERESNIKIAKYMLSKTYGGALSKYVLKDLWYSWKEELETNHRFSEETKQLIRESDMPIMMKMFEKIIPNSETHVCIKYGKEIVHVLTEEETEVFFKRIEKDIKEEFNIEKPRTKEKFTYYQKKIYEAMQK